MTHVTTDTNSPVPSLGDKLAATRSGSVFFSFLGRVRRIFDNFSAGLETMESGTLSVLVLLWFASFGMYFAGHILFALMSGEQ